MARLEGDAPNPTEDMGNIPTHPFGLRFESHFGKIHQHMINPIEDDDI